MAFLPLVQRKIKLSTERVLLLLDLSSSNRAGLRHWSEEVIRNVLGNLAADLVAVTHRVTPVQPGPNTRVIDFAHNRVHVEIRSPVINDLWDSGRESPSHFIGAKIYGHRICYGGFMKNKPPREFVGVFT